jgi:hypothetical protein
MTEVFLKPFITDRVGWIRFVDIIAAVQVLFDLPYQMAYDCVEYFWMEYRKAVGVK